jgi:uncharacterized membrane protein
MWICPRCSEQHSDQFSECWKCAGATENEHITAAPPLPRIEPRLRPTSAILKRAFIGFCVGVIATMLFGNVVNLGFLVRMELEHSLLGTTFLSLTVGWAFGLAVGLFYWIVLPYEPTKKPVDTVAGACQDEKSRHGE